MKIALQLYSLCHLSEQQGLCATLDKAKELGYDGVEFAGLYGLTPEQAHRELRRRGLLCAGFHEGIDWLREHTDEAVAMAHCCEAASLVIPYYDAPTADGWRALGEDCRQIAAALHRVGIPLGYHNHCHELRPMEGETPLDILLGCCTPEELFFEMDTRHVAVGGADPVAYARRYAGRIPVIHIRDTDGDRDTAVGEGILDFPAILAACGEPEWCVMENENFGENEEELRRSAAYLRRILA